MPRDTIDVLKAAVDAAKKANISTIVVASSTGKTASMLLDLLAEDKLRVIVVTPDDDGKTETRKRFDDNIRKRLLARCAIVYTRGFWLVLRRHVLAKLFGRFGLPRWYEGLKEIKSKHGTGIKVCHLIVGMLIGGRVLRAGKVVAIAGVKSGANSAAILSVQDGARSPLLEDIICRP